MILIVIADKRNRPKVEDDEKRILIYLTKDELKALYDMPLSGMKERVQDLFLIGCYTAMRYDEFSKIEKGCNFYILYPIVLISKISNFSIR